jgi:hypothetical protein
MILCTFSMSTLSASKLGAMCFQAKLWFFHVALHVYWNRNRLESIRIFFLVKHHVEGCNDILPLPLKAGDIFEFPKLNKYFFHVKQYIADFFQFEKKILTNRPIFIWRTNRGNRPTICRSLLCEFSLQITMCFFYRYVNTLMLSLSFQDWPSSIIAHELMLPY